MRHRGRGCCWVVLWLVLGVPTVWAQHQAYNVPSTLSAEAAVGAEQQRRQLFARMQNDPADTDAAFAYAVLSTQLGDYEAAIGTYERLLVMHPQTPRLQLELGALYFRLGAYRQARPLFESVASREDTPPNVQMRIAGYLTAIAGQQQQDSRGFSGRISVGVRSESNANAAPDAGMISLNGLDYSLTPSSQAASDSSAQLGVQVRWRQPFSGHGHRFDAVLFGSSNHQHDLHRLDNQVVEMRAGPDWSIQRWGLREGRAWLSAVAAQSWLEGSRYQRSVGVSTGVRWAVARQAGVQVTADWRNEDYTPAAAMAAAKDYTGDRQRFSAMYSQQVSANWQWMGGIAWEQRDARRRWEDYHEPRVQAGLSHRYRALFGNEGAPWTLALTGQHGWRHYAAPMPVIDWKNPQRSQESQLQLVNTVPLGRRSELQLYVGWRQVDSNYDIRNYINRYAGLTLAHQF